MAASASRTRTFGPVNAIVCPSTASASPVCSVASRNAGSTRTPGNGACTETATRSATSSFGTSARSGRAAMIDSASAASPTVVASGPFSSMPKQPCTPTSRGTVPDPGLMPNTPQTAAGMRIEPRPSLPWATGTIAEATAAALPPEDPPAVRVGSHGLRTTPVALPLVPQIPSSGIREMPTTRAPAARSRRTTS